jgi:hypothetical protein
MLNKLDQALLIGYKMMAYKAETEARNTRDRLDQNQATKPSILSRLCLAKPYDLPHCLLLSRCEYR